MSSLDRNYQWFKDNQEMLYSKYPNQYAVIANESILETATTGAEALDIAIKKSTAGEFIIKQCTKNMAMAQYVNDNVRFT